MNTADMIVLRALGVLHRLAGGDPGQPVALLVLRPPVHERPGEDLGSADEPMQVEERVVPSPFDYARQVLVAVPTDLPPAEVGGDDFQAATARVVRDVAEASDGGIFALFTSHAALRRVAQCWPASS